MTSALWRRGACVCPRISGQTLFHPRRGKSTGITIKCDRWDRLSRQYPIRRHTRACPLGIEQPSGTAIRGRLRYDTSQYAGGTFYDTYAHAQTLVGTTPITRASLVLDSGWAGDQQLTLGSAAVNDNTFTPSSPTMPTKTCKLPAADIKVTKVSGTPPLGVVNEPISIQPADTNGQFRIVDCKYMYNLATSSLSGTGQYKVEVVINGTPASGAAYFSLK